VAMEESLVLGKGGGGKGMFRRVRREGERIELGFSPISN